MISSVLMILRLMLMELRKIAVFVIVLKMLRTGRSSVELHREFSSIFVEDVERVGEARLA